MKQFTSVTTGLLVAMCLVLMSFSTEDLVKPKAGINETFTESLSLTELKKLDEISIDVDGEDQVVISFRFIHAPKTGSATMKTYKGNKISDSWMLSKIQKAAVDDRILVDKVIAVNSKGLKTVCNPAIHTLVE